MDDATYREGQLSMEDSMSSGNQVTNGSSKRSSFSNTDSSGLEQEANHVLVTNGDVNENSEKHEFDNNILAATAGGGDTANHIQSNFGLPEGGNGDGPFHSVVNSLQNQQNLNQEILEDSEDFPSKQDSTSNLGHSRSSQEKTLVDNFGGVPDGQQKAQQSVIGEVEHQFERSSTQITVLKTGSPVGDGGLVEAAEEEEVGVEEETYLGRKADFSPVPTPLLPPLEEPVPEGWVSLEGDFVLVLAVYQTHLGSEMLAAPDARLQDGLINLMMVRKGVSKAAMFRLFLSFSQGNHVSSPHVEVIKVLAFRLEPHNSNGNIMVDGERFEPAPIQAQILPGLARVMAIR